MKIIRFIGLIVFYALGVFAIEEKLPLCASYDDVHQYHGKKVLIYGRYEVDLIQGGKKLQAAIIVLPDKTRLIRSYRPIKKEYQFVGKKVKIIGTVYRNAGQSEYVQQVMAPHVYIDSIELAGGETPYETVPEKIPAGTWISTEQDMEENDDKWVHIYGKLLYLKSAPSDSFWGDALIRTEAGVEVRIKNVHPPKWKMFVGMDVTVTGIINISRGKDHKKVFLIASLSAVCKGKSERCGIHDP